VAAALARDRARCEAREARLTPREREVFRGVVVGHADKRIAAAMAIAERTVKMHRAHVMEQTEASSIAELVGLAETLHAFDEATHRAPRSG
jgi:FixJ family two-component response regulator